MKASRSIEKREENVAKGKVVGCKRHSPPFFADQKHMDIPKSIEK